MSDLAQRFQRVPLPADEQGRAREAFVLLTPAGDPKAFLNLCPHLDVPLDVGSPDVGPRHGHLVCHTHGARFRVLDGVCTWGPCVGEALRPVPLERDGDRLLLVFEGERIEVARLEPSEA